MPIVGKRSAPYVPLYWQEGFTGEQRAAVVALVARHALDAEDEVELLDCLGLAAA